MAHQGSRAVSFPTAVVDLRPVAAGYDNALAWLAKYRWLKPLGIPVARWTRRLVVHVQRIHRQTFGERTPNEHELVCLWVRNGGNEDSDGVRFQTRWNADSALLNVKTAEGLWFGARAGDPGQNLDRTSADVSLPAGGASEFVGQYVALAVKYKDDEHAYIVTPENHQHYQNQGHTWRAPSDAIAPGLHVVDVAFRSHEGGASLLRLTVMNPGRGAELVVQIQAGQMAP